MSVLITTNSPSSVAGAEAPPIAMLSRVIGTLCSAQRNIQHTFSGVK